MKNDTSIQMIQSGGTQSGDLLVPPAPPLTRPWTRGLPGRWPEGVVLKGRPSMVQGVTYGLILQRVGALTEPYSDVETVTLSIQIRCA